MSTDNIHKANDLGMTELHSAAYHEDINWVKRCIEGGLDVNAKDDKNWTPIVWAISMASTTAHGQAEEIIQYLYDNGASLDVEPRPNESLIDFAQGIDSGVYKYVKAISNNG